MANREWRFVPPSHIFDQCRHINMESVDFNPSELKLNPISPLRKRKTIYGDREWHEENPEPAEFVSERENAAPPKELILDNAFEMRISQDMIRPGDNGVTLEHIGAPDEIKKTIEQLVLLPLKRPDLFKGGLPVPCRSILLFGPPGTGKTMLAKAIANEAKVSFINVSLSTITSQCLGEEVKNVRALFTLAAKVSPTIIFIDEVDGMFIQRTGGVQQEAMRRIKNEFMSHWDGLTTKTDEHILVLAATNRPFELDEAIVKRFEYKIMLDLPSTEIREKILRILLLRAETEELDYKKLATMTKGYSGRDLKTLCNTAAHLPIHELVQEGNKAKEKKNTQEGEEMIIRRPLKMADMKTAKSKIPASNVPQGTGMNELKQWNTLYGYGASREMEQFTYFM